MEIQLKFSDPRAVSKSFKHYIVLSFNQSVTTVTNTTVVNQTTAGGVVKTTTIDLLKPVTGAVGSILATTTVLTEITPIKVTINISLPRQFSDSISIEDVEVRIKGPSKGTVKYSLGIALGASLILKAVASYSLQTLWDYINSLQLVTLIPLMNIAMPANLYALLSYIEGPLSFNYLE